jgi:uncharacterized protein (DUF433 family)
MQSKFYVHEDREGALRLGSLGISLDSVVVAVQEGHSAEAIQQSYPALSLEEVYGAIAFYLGNQHGVDEYLQRQDERWRQLREEIANSPSPVVERLRGLKKSSNPIMS